MINPRIHGKAPFEIAVIHGGPGAGGEMAEVAHELSSTWGILEPIQTASSLEGQVQELRSIIEESSEEPVTLIGFSWGAWLSFILAARYPPLVRKLVLVGGGPFEEKYVPKIMDIRLSHLSVKERDEIKSIFEILKDQNSEGKDKALVRMGALFSRANAFDPVERWPCSGETDIIPVHADIFQGVWEDASELRRTGKLLALGRDIQCPVVALHGDYDPHPADGVRVPLEAVLRNFRFILLKDCGHMPWVERRARDKFFEILRKELG